MKFLYRPPAEDETTMHGWVKPQRKRTLPELEARIAALGAELLQLEAEATDLRQGARLAALVSARNIVRAHQLTVEDLA